MRSTPFFRILRAIPFGACVAASSARGQQLFAEIANPHSPATGDSFGYAVAWAGDIDGDGVDDALISAPFVDVAPTWSREGAVYVISGADGSTIRTHFGPEALARLGIGGLAAGADLDQDGVPDYSAGTFDAPSTTGAGTVYVYSGATGDVLYTLVGENPYDDLCCPRFLGDVDGDGVEDLGLVASGFHGGRGRAYVYSGATMTLLYTVTGTKADQNITPVCGLGDLDGDGFGDFSVGWDGWTAGPNGEGKIEVYSGATGTLLYRRVGEATNDMFGHSESWLGDVDGDGTPDFMVRALAYGDIAQGRVYVYSGPTGKLLYQFDGRYQEEHFGMLPLIGRIDLNGDGFGDLLIGTSYYPSGSLGVGPPDSSVFAYSGRTGRFLYEFRGKQFGAASESLGSSLSSFGDFNHDGFDDVIVGAEGWTDGHFSSAGRVYIYGGNDLFLQADQESYAAGDSITIANRGGEPGALSMIVLTDVSGTATFVPILIGTLDANGELAFTGTVPNGLTGLTLQFMGYAQKASGRGLADSIPETLAFN